MTLKIEDIQISFCDPKFGVDKGGVTNFNKNWVGVVDWFNQLEQEHPVENNPWVLVCQDILRTIPDDCVNEFYNLLIFNQSETINNAGQATALLLIVLVNMADNFLEVTGENSLEKVFKTPGFLVKERSLNEGFEAVKRMAKLSGVTDFEIRLESILKAQQEGMNWVKTSREIGRPSYSFKQALEYRQKTVKAYFTLLADLGIKNEEDRRAYVGHLMTIQLTDDNADVDEDWLTQVNPFAAAAVENGQQRTTRVIFSEVESAYLKK